MISDKIRQLREKYGISQAELARRLDVTRSSINAWESGLSTPTTQYVVALSKLFHVSSDYLLGLTPGLCLSLEGYTQEQLDLLTSMIKYFDIVNEK